jgi:hypothetical protein
MTTVYVFLGLALLLAALVWAVSSRASIREQARLSKKSAEVRKEQTKAALEKPDKAGLEEILDDGEF